MNTKGMKFLAVLAVLAMAFVAFVAIAPAGDSEAAATEFENVALFTDSSEVDGEPAAYYVNASVTNATAFTGSVIFYVYPGQNGVTLNLTPATASTATIYVMTAAATESTDGYSGSYDPEYITYVSAANGTATDYVISADGSISTTDMGTNAVTYGMKLTKDSATYIYYPMGAEETLDPEKVAYEVEIVEAVLTIDENSGASAPALLTVSVTTAGSAGFEFTIAATTGAVEVTAVSDGTYSVTLADGVVTSTTEIDVEAITGLGVAYSVGDNFGYAFTGEDVVIDDISAVAVEATIIEGSFRISANSGASGTSGLFKVEVSEAGANSDFELAVAATTGEVSISSVSDGTYEVTLISGVITSEAELATDNIVGLGVAYLNDTTYGYAFTGADITIEDLEAKAASATIVAGTFKIQGNTGATDAALFTVNVSVPGEDSNFVLSVAANTGAVSITSVSNGTYAVTLAAGTIVSDEEVDVEAITGLGVAYSVGNVFGYAFTGEGIVIDDLEAAEASATIVQGSFEIEANTGAAAAALLKVEVSVAGASKNFVLAVEDETGAVSISEVSDGTYAITLKDGIIASDAVIDTTNITGLGVSGSVGEVYGYAFTGEDVVIDDLEAEEATITVIEGSFQIVANTDATAPALLKVEVTEAGTSNNFGISVEAETGAVTFSSVSDGTYAVEITGGSITVSEALTDITCGALFTTATNYTYYASGITDAEFAFTTDGGEELEIAEGASISGKVTLDGTDLFEGSFALAEATATGAVTNGIYMYTDAETAEVTPVIEGVGITVSNLVLSSDIIISGDVTINGLAFGSADSYTIYVDSLSSLTITGDVAIDTVVIFDGSVTFDTDSAIEFGTSGYIVISDDISVLGSVTGDKHKNIVASVGGLQVSTTVDNQSVVSSYSYTTGTAPSIEGVTPKTVTIGDETVVVFSAEELIAAYEDGTIAFIIASDIDFNKDDLGINGYEFKNVTLTILESDVEINVGYDADNRFTLTLDNCVIRDSTVDRSTQLNINAKSSLEIVESKLFLQVVEDEDASVSISGTESTYDGAAGDVEVGYGSTLYMSGSMSTGTTVYVWGNAVVPAGKTLTINNGIKMFTYAGATVNVLGTLSNQGSIVIADGAELNVVGTMTISNTNGGAALTVEGEANIDGTLNVNAPGSGITAENTVLVSETGEMNVIGTMTVAGTLSGEVRVSGEFTFRGTSDNAVVQLDNGVSVTITSVIGTITVQDTNLLAETLEAKITAGTAAIVKGYNQAQITDARGIIASASSSVETKTVGGVAQKQYTATMSIQGTVSPVDTTVSSGYTSLALSQQVILGLDMDSSMKVGEVLTLSKYMWMTNSAKLSVSGTLNVVQDSTKLTNTGTITVSGLIEVSDKGTITEGTMNAAKTVLNNSDGTSSTKYRSLDKAILDIATVDDKTVFVLGSTVKLASNASVKSGETLSIVGTKLTIKDGYTLTIEDGGKVTGTNATISVSGTMDCKNYAADVKVKSIKADVINNIGTERIYTNLANALANAQYGSEITTCGVVELYSSIAIPEGVTVIADYPIVLDYTVILSVNGALNMTKKAQDNIGTYTDVISTVNLSDYDVTTNPAGKVLVSGSFSEVGDDASEIMEIVSGAHYAKEIGAYTTYYVTTVEIAALSVDDDLTGYNGSTYPVIRIIGDVNAGDVIFSKTDDMDVLAIVVSGTAALKTTAYIESMTLSGAVLLISGEEYISYTGDIYAFAGDSIASVSLSKVSGDLGFCSLELTTTEVDYLLMVGEPVGKVNITAGKVTVASTNATQSALNAGTLTVDDSVMTVASGATLEVIKGSTLTVGDDGAVDTGAALIVDGTIDVVGADLSVIGIMDLNGTMNISESVDGEYAVEVEGLLNIVGTVNISEDLGKEGLLTVTGESATEKGIITVGSKPKTLSSAGSVDGTIVIDSYGIVKIYSGLVSEIVDSTLAELEGTDVYVNGSWYMTIYSEDSPVKTIVKTEKLEIPGLGDTITVYTDPEMTEAISADVLPGVYLKVYGRATVSSAYMYVTIPALVTGSIDGVSMSSMTTDAYGRIALPVGNHTIVVQVYPGYEGDLKMVFDGKTITGNFEITSDMAKKYNYGNLSDKLVLTVSGDIEPVTPDTPEPEKDDNGFGITQILMVVLVILVAVMTVIAVFRLNRS